MIVLALIACGTTPSKPPEGKPGGDGERRDAPAAPAAASSELNLSGTITYDGTATGQTLFVSIKDPSHPGPPLAAKKLPPGPFPLAFSLTGDDAVSMGAPRGIPEKVALTVTLDADGNAMTKDPADPKATMEVAATSANLTVALAPSAP